MFHDLYLATITRVLFFRVDKAPLCSGQAVGLPIPKREDGPENQSFPGVMFSPVADDSGEFNGNLCRCNLADHFCTASARRHMSASMG